MSLTFQKEEDFVSYIKSYGEKNSSIILTEKKGGSTRVLIGIEQLIPTGILAMKNKNGRSISIEVCSGYL